jgi:hypothetical protein
MSEFKKYDTKATTSYWNVRLTKDAEVKDFGDNKLVKLSIVDSSRSESDEELWVEVNPNKSQHAMTSYMEKGDEFGASGKLTFRRYGEDKVAFNLRNAEVFVSPGLIAILKERGFAPGPDAALKGDTAAAAPVKTPAKRGRPVGSGKVVATKAPAKKTIPIEIDLDDDEAVEE